jgi:hypothetical protein
MPYNKDHDRFARLFRPRSGETLETATVKLIVQRDSLELPKLQHYPERSRRQSRMDGNATAV